MLSLVGKKLLSKKGQTMLIPLCDNCFSFLKKELRHLINLIEYGMNFTNNRGVDHNLGQLI